MVVDTPVVVTDWSNNELTRHFAKYEDDKIYYWNNGATSLTKKYALECKSARLLTEEEIDEIRHKNDVIALKVR